MRISLKGTEMMKLWKAMIACGAVFAVVSVTSLGLLALQQKGTAQIDEASPANDSVATAQQAAPGLTVQNALFLQQSLNSADRATQAKALAPQLRGGEWDAAALLPSGARLAVDQSTFAVDQNGIGSVNASVSGSVTAQFVLLLSFVDNQWLLVSTVRK